MGVARQGAAAVLGPGALLAEQVELGLGEAALEERPRVDARRGVALDEDLVAVPRIVGGPLAPGPLPPLPLKKWLKPTS
jgi:hypothetical protein